MVLFGFIVIYGIVLFLFPYYLVDLVPTSLFLTYIANVDIIANNLAINYPHLFKLFYNPETSTLFEYISYNVISIFALTGIFIYGIYHIKRKVPEYVVLLSMITMTIITYTLPTDGIPYITNLLLDRDKSLKEYEIEITTTISACFLFIEWFIIHHFIMN